MGHDTPLQRGWHNAYDLHYHCVFAVKYRRALLDVQVTAELVRISQGIQERYEIDIECLGVDINHLHLLCAAPLKLAPSDIVRVYKSITARELFKALPLMHALAHEVVFAASVNGMCTRLVKSRPAARAM